MGDRPIAASPGRRERLLSRIGLGDPEKGKRRAAIAAAVLGVVLIVAGIALVYLPAGVVAAGAALLAGVTFDPDKAGRVTWPR